MSLDQVIVNKPPYAPHHPDKRPPVGKLPTKNVILTHEFNRILYALAVRTTTDAVYDSKYKYTLTEMLTDIASALTSNFEKIAEVSEAFNTLMKDCPEEFNTLKEIYDYINVNGDPKSALIELIDSKVDKEEGKGLSTHDFTDLLYEKLTNDYTKEQIDQFVADQAAATVEVSDRATILEDRADAVEVRVEDLENANNMIVSSDVPNVKDNDIWMNLQNPYPNEQP